ncbi:hypothetical protein RND81_01G057500 [Saponaria officinalis]|uniref:MULE transposase domain-containing protein n=1 Tax=Saponaria officinalis TaxID=3572 RepID=A0AAW1NC00_SAPOF
MSEDGSVDSFEEFGGDGVDYNPLFETTTCFADRDKAFDWALNIAEDNGFALVKANNGAKNRTHGLLASYFRCYRYGKSNGTAKGFGCHNHQLTKYKDGHRHYAGLDEEEKAYVEQQYCATVFPRDIKSGLHQKTPDKPQPSSTQIYSETSKIQKKIRGEKKPAQQMLALAVDANYVHWHETNPETHELTHVFMSHLEAVKMFRAYPHVVLMDSTYKTNVYKMTLVEVVGVTPVGSSFLIACVLIPSESEEGYTWLLQKLVEILECTGASPSAFVTDRELGLIAALRIIFTDTPHLLCRWHLNRAVESRATSMFKSEWYKNQVLRNEETGWWKVIDATNEEDFKEAWCAFNKKWEKLASYVSKTWGEHAAKFVLCYTNKYFHLGNTATSRVESAHSLLKAWLKSAHLTLDTMWSRIHSMPEGEHSKIRKELEQSRKNVSIKVIEIMEAEIRRCIELGIGTLEYDGNEVMPKNDNDMLEELIEKTRKSDPAYRKVFLEKMRDILHPEDEDILSPAVRENPKGRPRNSTTRSKSSFEHSQRKYDTPSTDASTNVGHRSIDFPAGPSGAPLERNFTIGPLSTWNKRFGVPEDLWGHFDGWVDVENDGHYGYRVISHAQRGIESDYVQMRYWCIREITGFEVYKALFEAGFTMPNGLTRYKNTLRRIGFFRETSCGEDHWMHSDDLFVFASIFNWTICVIAQNHYANGAKEWQCTTILPLRSSSQIVAPYGVLWIVNHKYHWMRLHSRGPADLVPMPPIDPAWAVFKDPSVAYLESLYQTNIDNWHTCMGSTARAPRRRDETQVQATRTLVFDDLVNVSD